MYKNATMTVSLFHKIAITALTFFFIVFSSTSLSALDSLSTLNIQSNKIILPPLSDLIDSAMIKSFEIRAQKTRIQQKKELTSIEKKKILRALTFNSQYSRGNNVAAIDNQLNNQPYYTKAVTDFYSGGIFLNVSIFQFAARKNNIENAKLQISIEQNNLEIVKRNLKIEISNIYMDIELKYKIMNMRAEALSVSNMNLSYIEKSFTNNLIKMATYSDVVEVNIKLKVAYEQSYTDYIKSVILLEEISGIKLHQK
jgi:outer membrane protein